MSDNIESRPSEDSPNDSPKLSGMPQLAKVVSHYDPTFMGKIQVEILRPVGNAPSEGQVQTVEMISPFYGVTGADYIGETDDYNNTQKSYGMWFVPPDVGTTVMVIFINGDPKRGYWFGCVADNHQNFMIPGLAATTYNLEGDAPRVPVAEYNKKVNDQAQPDATKVKKPQHPFTKRLTEQGLLKDDVRGITTSSARREAPSAVYGISTPGPIDKQNGAKKGARGTKEALIPDAFVSRLGGTTFVMDDGDDKFLRKKHAKDGPPEYAAVEQGETDGLPGIPHNELVRIRTRTGHQILLHNSEDLIYIANSRGTAWIELSSNGKIDIYAADSISMHTGKDFNITADGNINLTSKGDVNIKPTGKANINPGGDCNILAANTSIDGGNINLNSGVAGAAIVAPRVPDHEPWAGHENLHGSALKYTTTTDTFSKITPPKQDEETEQ